MKNLELNEQSNQSDAGKRIVSIVIPTKNGIEYIDEVLRSIFDQKISWELEVLIIDSGSSDGTIEVLKKYPVKIICIDSSSFNHGTTRTMGARKASGDVVVFMNQDATFVDQYSLSRLVIAMEGEDVVAAYARHVPRENHNPLRKREIEKAFPKYSSLLSGKELHVSLLSNLKKRRVCQFNTVCGVVKKEYFLKHPFVSIEFGEDVEWALRVFEDGKSIYYEASATVKHSHDFYRSFRETFQIYYDDAKFTKRIFGKLIPANPVTAPFLVLYLWGRDCYWLAMMNIRFLQKIRWFLRSPGVRIIEIFAIIVGYHFEYVPVGFEKWLSSVTHKMRR